MRVAWVVGGDLAQRTGGYVYDRLLIEGLRALGDEIHIVDPRGLENAWDEGQSGRFDAVVGDSLWAREIGPGFKRIERTAVRVLLVHHLASWEDEPTGHSATRADEARAIAASDRLVVTSLATAARLGDEYPGPPTEVVAPGADRLRAHPRVGRDDSVVELLFVGSLIPRKRVPMLLDAVEQVADPRLALTIVGDPGRDPPHAREIAIRVAGSAALRACVTAVGSVDDDALARAMAGADALVLPSSLEGYGMVVSEALHAGLAVLVARASAMAAEAAVEAALVFDDARGLADAIRQFMGDPTRRAAMHRAARQAKLPRWSEAATSFQRVLTDAVAAQTGRGRGRGPGQ